MEYYKWDGIQLRKIPEGWLIYPTGSDIFSKGFIEQNELHFAKTLAQAADIIEELRKKDV